MFTKTIITSAVLLALFSTGASAALPSSVEGIASEGLIQIATTGNPEGLHTELGGEVTESSVVADTVGQATLNGLLSVSENEHLAPMALVVDGVIYAMVAPTITKDNFILITEDGVARRMDVGNSEGTNEPYIVTEIDPNALPATVMGTASAGLIQLATTGNPEGLYAELGGEVVASAIVGETAGQASVDALLMLDQDEHLAPMALVAPTGEIYAMVAPTITKDNFIIVTAAGEAVRMDVGFVEGTNMPFRVTEIVSDGGTAWYVEFWNWLTGA
ncbi:hypothetical protein N9R27_01690 [Flavobacteriaceae bacterium]|nr:hypothetical protein [Flavobacteriaceae bacterium]